MAASVRCLRALTHIDAAWLTEALQQRCPGTDVLTTDIVDLTQGTSTRMRLRATYGLVCGAEQCSEAVRRAHDVIECVEPGIRQPIEGEARRCGGDQQALDASLEAAATYVTVGEQVAVLAHPRGDELRWQNIATAPHEVEHDDVGFRSGALSFRTAERERRRPRWSSQ